MDLISLTLTAIGVLLSIWALVKASSAEKAVSKVIEKREDQATRDNARELLTKLTNARDAAIARRKGASRLSSAGRSKPGDIQALQIAQDALATSAVGTDEGMTPTLRAAAVELDTALIAIAADADRDGWADALGSLQGIIPEVDVLQRKLGTKALR